jgi:predicted small lipoprotein YifL
MKSLILSSAVALTLAAALAGCSADKKGPFTDVTARDQEQSSDVQPTTRPAAVQAQPAPTITVTATPAADFVKDPSDSVPAAVVVAEKPAEPKPVTITVTDSASPPANPASPAPAPMGKLVVRVDEHGRLSRDFAPSAFVRPSGDVKGGPMYWPNYNRTIKRSDAENFVFEPMEFIVDTLLMPARACITPPWTDVVYDPVPQDNNTPASVTERQPVTEERMLKK